MKIEKPLPATHSYHLEDGGSGAGINWVGPMVWPRRACIDQHTPTEKAIGKAAQMVEELGADLLLTHAGMKLREAQNLVADWLESKVGELRDGKLVVIDSGSAVPSGVHSCRKCGGAMKPGKAILNTYAASDEGTVNEAAHVGTAPLVDCVKCEACGWSVTDGVSASVPADESKKATDGPSLP